MSIGCRKRRADSMSFHDATEKAVVSGDSMSVFVPPHPLMKHWLSVMRNRQTPCPVLKHAMAELGRLLIYEASRDWRVLKFCCLKRRIMEKAVYGDRLLVFVPSHPSIRNWVSVLCNEMTPCPEFKNAMAELGRLLIYEASRNCLPTIGGEFESPPTDVSVEFFDPKEPIAIVPISRAGLALAEHAESVLPAAKTYHIGIRRNEETLQPTVYLNKLPEKFPEGSRVFVVDPILATGDDTLVAALELLKEGGVDNTQIKVISAIVAPPAVKKLSEKYPGVHVYAGTYDHPSVSEKGPIIPGLGDAGDRCFGK